jgi:hypothetical protein
VTGDAGLLALTLGVGLLPALVPVVTAEVYLGPGQPPKASRPVTAFPRISWWTSEVPS